MIAFNARFLTQKMTGVQRYAYEIAFHLKQLCSDIRFLTPQNILHEEYLQTLEAEPKGTLKGHFWEQLELPNLIPSRSILLSLGNTAPIMYPRKIVAIHDVSFLNTHWVTQQFSMLYKLLLPRVIHNSLGVVTVSEFSKRELMKHFDVPEKKISVIPNAVSSRFPAFVNTTELENSYGNYILAVSSLEPRKNFSRLLKAFNRLGLKETHLVIVGSSERIYCDPQLVELVGQNKNIHFTGYVSDTQLAVLYNNARLFVFPSLYEGFGIPPLEAMSVGCPTVVSNVASLPEVCGDASHYVDPENIDSIITGIREVLTDEGLRKDLINKGHQQVKRYDWKKSAQMYLNLVESM